MNIVTENRIDAERKFVATWWRQIVTVLVLDLPAFAMGCIFLRATIQSIADESSTQEVLVFGSLALAAFSISFFWIAICHEKIMISGNGVARYSILGRQFIPLSDVKSVSCEIQGRGNTLLAIYTTKGRRRMGFSLPTRDLHEMVSVIRRMIAGGSHACHA